MITAGQRIMRESVIDGRQGGRWSWPGLVELVVVAGGGIMMPDESI